MTQTRIAQMAEIIDSRLGVLAHIVERAGKEAPSVEALLSSRIAPDMHPFPTQVSFVCHQANGFAHFCGGPAPVQPEDSTTLTLAELQTAIASARQAVQSAATHASDELLSADKRIDLPGGQFLMLTGQSYFDDWLLPNIYFHMSIAYALARGLGVPLGKIDWMAFLGPKVQQG
jgi:hypothetical protein